MFIRSLCLASALVHLASAHIAAWHKGMYCLNGPQQEEDQNAQAPVNPLYDMEKEDWWFQHYNKCDQFPPAKEDFLELPAGGNFTVELATNRAATTLSYDGKYTSDWPDGKVYPSDYHSRNSSCITEPNMHAQNYSMAAGTAFAISYQSDLAKVTPENLVVFSVKYHTPWTRIATYQVPKNLPQCPDGGCTCAWGWVPNGCGEPNMYMHGFKCNVTGATSKTAVSEAKPPVWCEDDQAKCVKGAKQLIFWNQRSGNNTFVGGLDASGYPKSPGYNMKCGFQDGAQDDIFLE
ncbi:hypothetical protein BDQ17DRAFT_1409017 [Cyathus striatus]|nr:hypothetical protein BDQ17DRAFT_1409017 [Cyathus striatus]